VLVRSDTGPLVAVQARFTFARDHQQRVVDYTDNLWWLAILGAMIVSCLVSTVSERRPAYGHHPRGLTRDRDVFSCCGVILCAHAGGRQHALACLAPATLPSGLKGHHRVDRGVGCTQCPGVSGFEDAGRSEDELGTRWRTSAEACDVARPVAIGISSTVHHLRPRRVWFGPESSHRFSRAVRGPPTWEGMARSL